MGKNKFVTQQSTGVFSFWRNSIISYNSIKKVFFFTNYSQKLLCNILKRIFTVKLFLNNNSRYVQNKSKVRYSFFKKFKRRKTKIIQGSIFFLKYQNWIIVKLNYINSFKLRKFKKKNVYINFLITTPKMNYKTII